MSSSVPSVARRAFVALAVLVAFYLTVIAIALLLLPIPVLVFMGMDHIRPIVLIAVAACCWIPAGLLLSGLLGVRPRRFEEPGLPLQREHAPALFAMLDELAHAAGTTAPHDVYISTTPEAFVAETGGGFLGSNSRRVLCIGAPLLATSTVGELRAMLAHELGHYLGGDTASAGCSPSRSVPSAPCSSRPSRTRCAPARSTGRSTSAMRSHAASPHSS
jgi:Zn-dependent protease with chaperone function